MQKQPQAALFRPDASRALATFMICLAGSIIEGFDIQALAVSAPSLMPLFGLSKLQLGMLFSVTNIGMTIGATFGGGLADRFGTKRIFVIAVALFGASTCAAAATHSFETLATARFIAGLGFGASIPITVIMAMEVCSPGRRSFVTTMSLCGQPAGGIIVIALATLAGDRLDWRTLFLIGGFASLMLAAAGAALLPTSTQRVHRVGAVPTSTGWREVLFGGGRTPTTLLLWVLFACAFVTAWIFISWLPILVIGKGVPALVGQKALLTYSVGGIAGALLIGRLIDRAGFRNTLAPVYALMVIFVLFLAASNSPGPILLASALVGACALGSGFALMGLAATFFPAEGRGKGVGSTIAVGRITSVAAPVAVGGLLTAGASATQVLLFVAGNAFVAAAALWGLSRFKQYADRAPLSRPA